MKFRQFSGSLCLSACALLLVACAHDTGVQTVAVANETAAKSAGEPAEQAKPVICTEPRSQACTMDYRPVCATRDTGIRCVTTPCPSSEQKTFSNGCSACSDPKVSQYVPEACPEEGPNALDVGEDG